MRNALDVTDYKASKAIRMLFSDLGLPEPGMSEFYTGANNRKLVFLTDLGLVIRVTPQPFVMKQSHPRFLRSIFNAKAGTHEIDIDPGIDCPVSPEDSDSIYKQIEKDGVRVIDRKPMNLGYIPGTRHALMIDLDQYFIFFTKDLTRKQNPANDLQSEAFGHIHYLAKQVWENGIGNSNYDAVRRFLKACAKMKKEGQLMACWSDPKNSYKESTQISENYRRRISKAIANIIK